MSSPVHPALLLRRCRLAGSGPSTGPVVGPVVDVLMRGGAVVATTPSSGPGTAAVVPGPLDGVVEVLDLDGRWLLPGLWDEHVHLGQWALVRDRLDLSAATSAAHAASLVRRQVLDDAAAGHPPAPLVGAGFRDALWPDAPSPELLDAAAVAPGAGTGAPRPVVLVSADLHCAWLSTGAARSIAAPLGVVPDASGLVREEDAFAVARALGRVGEEALDAAVAGALAEAAARGVVGVVDLEMTDAPGGTPAVWARRVAARGGAASAGLRLEAGTYPQHLERSLAQGVRSGRPLLAAGPPTVVGGPLKVITDGSLNTRTACCLDPYPGAPASGRGELTWPLEQLVELLVRGHRGGLAPAVHAIGDAAVRNALDAFAALAAQGWRGGRIEHAQLVADADVPRFAQLGVVASVQPAHLLDDRDVAEVHWRGRTGRAFALRALLDAGARLALGSDAPVAPLDPWLAVAAAVGRGGEDDGRGGRGAWHPEQALSPAEALAASARGRTRVAAGGPADVVAVEEDPLLLAGGGAAAAAGTRAALTVVDGRVVHAAAALAATGTRTA